MSDEQLAMNNEILNWTICKSCLGRSTKRRKVKKKLKTQYKIACDIFDKSDKKGAAPIPPKGAKYPCETCKGSGLVLSHKPHIISTQKFPTIAIIGGGIGGVALARSDRFVRSRMPGWLFHWAAMGVETHGSLWSRKTPHQIATTNGALRFLWNLSRCHLTDSVQSLWMDGRNGRDAKATVPDCWIDRPWLSLWL